MLSQVRIGKNMKFIDLFKLSTRMFKARTSRTLLTILGMSIGIGAVLLLVSFGFGLQKTLLERITTAESLLTLDVAAGKSEVVTLNNDVLKKIESMEGVAEISPALELTGQGKVDELSADIVFTAAKPSFLRMEGLRTEKDIFTDENPQNMIITSAVTKVFGKSTEEMLNKEIEVSFILPKESGIEEGTQSNFEIFQPEKKYKIAAIIEGDENVAYINLASLEVMKIEKFHKLKVKCASDTVLSSVRDKILEQGLLVSSLSDVVADAKKIFTVIQVVLAVFGIVALTVSAIGMFNTMTITLMERTEEIGIMKSIGASDKAISMMFIMESAIMGFFGGLMGVIIGLGGGVALNFLVNMIAARFGGVAVDLFDSPWQFISGIIISAAVVGFLTGVVPAWRASKIDPLDALRYK